MTKPDDSADPYQPDAVTRAVISCIRKAAATIVCSRPTAVINAEAMRILDACSLADPPPDRRSKQKRARRRGAP